MIFREFAKFGTLTKFGQRNINTAEVETIKAEALKSPTMSVTAAICVSLDLTLDPVRAAMMHVSPQH